MRSHLLFLVLLPALAQAQNVGISPTGAQPNNYALLDVDNVGQPQGVLLPRLSSADRISIAGLAATEDGLTVYDTTTKTYWYWDGTQWVEIGATGGGSGWLLTGNTGTVGGTHFIGTTDDVQLSFRVNNEHAGVIQSNVWANTFFGHEAGLGSANHNNTAMGKGALSSGTNGWNNTAHGAYALENNLTGGYNTSIGVRSLRSNTSGSSNTAVGLFVLSSNVTGNYNSGIGAGALASNNGNSNTALGNWALSNNVAGSNATAIGAYAMQYANNTGTAFENSNVAVGYEALRGSFDPSVNSGLGNTALGYRTLVENADGYENTASGYHALRTNTTGWQNTAHGAWALNENTTGHSNSAVGTGALRGNSTGYGNTGIGHGALYMNTAGWQNSALGYSTLVSSTGDANTAIGCMAMCTSTTGNRNTALGTWALFGNYYTGHDNTAIGAGSGTNADLSGTITLGYNSTAGTDYRAVIGTVANTGLTGGFGAWQDLSDGRFKRQVQEDVPGLDFITLLRPVTYTLDAHGVDAFLGIAQRMDTLPDDAGKAQYQQRLNDVSAQRQTGFIAQDVEEAAAQVGYDFSGVHRPTSETDHYTLGYASFTVPIVKSVQELHAMVLEQQRMNEQLRDELEVLRRELREMKAGR